MKELSSKISIHLLIEDQDTGCCFYWGVAEISGRPTAICEAWLQEVKKPGAKRS